MSLVVSISVVQEEVGAENCAVIYIPDATHPSIYLCIIHLFLFVLGIQCVICGTNEKKLI